MRKEIFTFEILTPQKIRLVQSLKATGIFVGQTNLEKSSLILAKKNSLKINVEIGLFVGKEFWDTFPDGRPINASGKPIDPEEWYYGVCPNHPVVRQQRLRRISEIIHKFPIDGLWLDFVRYPGHWEVADPHIPDTCYCHSCLARYQEITGEILPENLDEAIAKIKENTDSWQNFREQQITDFVNNVRKAIDRSGKKIELGAFVMPDDKRAVAVAQNLSQISPLVDVLTPMLYHVMRDQPVDWVAKQSAWSSRFGKPVLPIIQTEDKPIIFPPEEFKEALVAATKAPSTGVIVLFLEDILKNTEKTEIFKSFA